MSVLAEVLVDLEDAPDVALMVLLVLRVDRVELADGAGGREEGRVEEPGETRERAAECCGGDVEVVVRVRGAGVRVGASAVLGEVLEAIARLSILSCEWLVVICTSEYSFSLGYCSVP